MSADALVSRLLDAGLSKALVTAALPDWWTADESGSASARTMVSMLLARRLSLDPESLLDDNVPVGFLHTGPVKFKHMKLGPGDRRDALIAFAKGVGRTLLSAMPADIPEHQVPADPLKLRQLLLSTGSPFISFGDVLSACWSLGIPVLHLRLFPARTKGVTAITVRQGARHVILVARESGPDAQYMFHVAHELGHIALGHLQDATAIVDADPSDPANQADELVDDEEERAADAYAQALLSGNPNFEVVPSNGPGFGTARELAQRAMQAGPQLGIDPGHIVMTYGYTTGAWPTAMAAVKLLPQQPERPGSLVNKVLWGQISPTDIDPSSLAYLEAVAPV